MRLSVFESAEGIANSPAHNALEWSRLFLEGLGISFSLAYTKNAQCFRKTLLYDMELFSNGSKVEILEN